jgi:hypothetical protein
MPTTTTTYANQITTALAMLALEPNRPKHVVHALANDDDLDGIPAKTKNYPLETLIAQASGGTEGTAITANTNLAMATSPGGTVVEGALIRSLVTEQAISKRVPGLDGVPDLIARGSVDEHLAALGPEVRRLIDSCMRKYEDDHCNLLAGFSQSVGTSGSDFVLANALSAVYLYDAGDPMHDDTAWVLLPNQVSELRTNLSSVVDGAIWFQQGDASFFNLQPDAARNGYIGTLLGRPIYQYSQTLATPANAGADVVGAYMAVGRGSPEDGQIGALAHLRNGGPIVRIQPDAPTRGVIVVVSMEYVAFEMRDASGIAIITDAP